METSIENHIMFNTAKAKKMSDKAKGILIDRVQEIIETDEHGEFFEQSLIDYAPLIKDKNYTPQQFVEAVRYCSLKQIHPKYAAWSRTFPDRLKKLEAKGEELGWDEENFQKTISAHASGYERNSLVNSIEAEMMIPTYLLYSGYRNKAMEKIVNLMDGKASTSKSFVYQKDEDGKIMLDEYGRKVKMVDEYGEPVMETYMQSVSPKVQGDMAMKLIDMTDIPTAKQIDINMNHSISDETIEAQKRAAEMFGDIAKQQREAMIKGAKIESVQQIGNTIEANILGDDEDVGEDTFYDD